MIRPTLSEAKEYAKQGYHMVPVCYEMLSDIITPINLLKKLKAENEHCYILESVENQELWGRYTFLGYSPKLDITCMNGTLTLKDENGAVIKETSGIHPEIFIREVLKDYKSPKIEGFPTFTGGLVGYFSYDYLRYSEKKLVLDAKDEEGFQDVDLMLFDKVIAFDNVADAIISVTGAEGTFAKTDVNTGKPKYTEQTDESALTKIFTWEGSWKKNGGDNNTYCNPKLSVQTNDGTNDWTFHCNTYGYWAVIYSEALKNVKHLYIRATCQDNDIDSAALQLAPAEFRASYPPEKGLFDENEEMFSASKAALEKCKAGKATDVSAEDEWSGKIFALEEGFLQGNGLLWISASNKPVFTKIELFTTDDLTPAESNAPVESPTVTPSQVPSAVPSAPAAQVPSAAPSAPDSDPDSNCSCTGKGRCCKGQKCVLYGFRC